MGLSVVKPGPHPSLRDLSSGAAPFPRTEVLGYSRTSLRDLASALQESNGVRPMSSTVVLHDYHIFCYPSRDRKEADTMVRSLTVAARIKCKQREKLHYGMRLKSYRTSTGSRKRGCDAPR